MPSKKKIGKDVEESESSMFVSTQSSVTTTQSDKQTITQTSTVYEGNNVEGQGSVSQQETSTYTSSYGETSNPYENTEAGDDSNPYEF